jgi:signal transduction histidine kinase
VGRCPPGVEIALWFCLLESIQNAAKHAGRGARVTVTLERKAGCMSFEVADDGSGFDPAAAAAGLGLLGMRDRLGAVGGSLWLDSHPDAGTRVSGAVPLRPAVLAPDDEPATEGRT